MVPSDVLDARLSVMSLAVAADSAWYVVDFQKADPFVWGKGRGCAMFDSKCPRNAASEFCIFAWSTGCSDDLQYISMCSTIRKNRHCKINLNDHSCKASRKAEDAAFRYGRFSVCHSCRVTGTGPLTVSAKTGSGPSSESASRSTAT